MADSISAAAAKMTAGQSNKCSVFGTGELVRVQFALSHNAKHHELARIFEVLGTRNLYMVAFLQKPGHNVPRDSCA